MNRRVSSIARLAAAIVGIWLALCWIVPATAATVIFYSAPDQTYGWCAGYSYSQCENEADQSCRGENGTDCRLAVECSGGAGAIAFSEDYDIGGMGAVCHARDENAARSIALELCMAAAHAPCTTGTAFSAHGRDMSKQKNAQFDLIWTAQVYLRVLGYMTADADGVVGGSTRSAVKSFETDLGLEPTGAIDQRLLSLLTYSSFGPESLNNYAAASVAGDSNIVQYGYNHADTASPAQSFTDWLLGRDSDEQRLALGTVVRRNGTACSFPAKAVSLLDKDTQKWTVECGEGTYAVSFAGSSILVASAEDNSVPQRVSGGDSETHDRHQAASIDAHHPAPEDAYLVAAKAVACQYRYTTLLASLAGMVQDKKPITENLGSPPPIDLGSPAPDDTAAAPPPQVPVQCDDIVVGPKDSAVCKLIEAPDQCVAKDKNLVLILHVDVDTNGQ